MNFLFACGGTAGHINPALAVAGKLRELLPSSNILFVGAEGMMEMSLVPSSGYEIKGINITNLSRDISLAGLKHNMITMRNIMLSHNQAKRIISEFNPDCVIGTGGYVCYPVLSAAHSLGIPTVIHESNAFPGLTTKLLSKKVDKILTGFQCDAFDDLSKVICVGTPVRDDFSKYTKQQAKQELGIDKPLVLSFMGSLGAGHMNKIISELIPMLGPDPDFHLVHVTGSYYYKDFEPKESEDVEVYEYLHDIAKYMIASDLVICRSGASTLSEITYIGKPAILVPSPNVTNNHQEKNARKLEEINAARVFLEDEFDAYKLLDTIKSMISDNVLLNEMSASSYSVSVKESVDRICEIILNLIK